MTIGKRRVDTGRGVRVYKTVQENSHVVEQALQQDHLQIEHVPFDQPVDRNNIPAVRYERDPVVIPVMEEVLVVQKRLRLKEEIRITRSSRVVISQETVILRSESVAAERLDKNSAHDGTNAAANATGGAKV